MFFDGKSEGQVQFVQPRVFRSRDLISPDGIQLQIEDEGNVLFMQPERFSTGARPRVEVDDEDDVDEDDVALKEAYENFGRAIWDEASDSDIFTLVFKPYLNGGYAVNTDLGLALKELAKKLEATAANAMFLQEAHPEILNTGARIDASVVQTMPKADKVEDKVSDKVTVKVEDKVSEVSEVSDKMSGKVSEVSDKMSGKVSEVSDKMSGKVSEVSDKMSGKVSKVSDEDSDADETLDIIVLSQALKGKGTKNKLPEIK